MKLLTALSASQRSCMMYRDVLVSKANSSCRRTRCSERNKSQLSVSRRPTVSPSRITKIGLGIPQG